MRIYNSLSKKIEEFEPVEEGKVMMYVCGLTPYDSAHIGHARTYVAFDTIKRFLINSGYEVYHIQNITDVEDKIIRRCMESGADPMKLTTSVHDEALEQFRALHIIDANIYPKVTGHIADIISMIESLIKNGYAYETKSGIYFDVQKFSEYGKLSGQDIEQMKAGVRKEVAEGKTSHLDFALWKKSKGEILEFDSPWGRGRPGWHIECSAMSRKYIPRPLDIHGGARDLIFPHHENEIAQSEGATAEQFAKYWMHTGFLTVEHEKMSKSLGNFITIKDSLSKFSPNALRLFYLQAHYRSPLDYEEDVLAAAGESVERIFNSVGLINEALNGEKPSEADQAFRKETNELIEKFGQSMAEDFDTPNALAALFGLLRVANAHISKEKLDCEQLENIKGAICKMLWILGLEEEKHSVDSKLEGLVALLSELGVSEKPESAEAALEKIISLRDEARSNKDYEKSDLIREKLLGMGIVLEDKAAGGIRWKLK